MRIRCLTIKNSEIFGLPDGVPLEELEGEEIMVCDYDAIYKGKFNFKLYGQISRFFEPVVVNFPGRVEDLMDSLISGAARVVLHPDGDGRVFERMLEVSEGIVLPAKSPHREDFINKGGRYLISDREVFSRFDQCYNVGPELSSEKYINVTNFPENLLVYI